MIQRLFYHLSAANKCYSVNKFESLLFAIRTCESRPFYSISKPSFLPIENVSQKVENSANLAGSRTEEGRKTRNLFTE